MSAPSQPPTDDRTALSAADLVKLASHLAEIREIAAGLDPSVRSALADMLRKPVGPADAAASGGRRGTFGLFAGQFTVGPEFFEPLPEEELRAWGEI